MNNDTPLQRSGYLTTGIDNHGKGVLRTRQFINRIKQARATRTPVIRITVCLFLLSVCSQALAQNENEATATVSVSISGVEDELLSNVQGFLPLFRFDGEEAPSVGRLRFLHAQSEETIPQSLAPFGYYRPIVESTLEQTDSVWQATYTIDPGEPIPVTSVNIKVTGEAESEPAFVQAIEASPLKQGRALLHQDYESLKQRFQVLASQLGYFDAVLQEGAIRINMDKYQAEVVLHFDSGVRYYLGNVSFNQDKDWLSENMLGRFSDIKPGQAYLADDLQRLQGDLSNTEYYDQVTLDVSPENADDQNVIPVNVNLVARNPTRYVFGAGYGTDTGARVKAGVTRRRLNTAGHHLTAEALIAQFKLGIAGEYIIPGADPRTDSWGLRASLQDENSTNSNYTSATIGGYYQHKDDLWLKTYSLDYLVERFEVLDGEDTGNLLIPSVVWTRTYPAEMDKRIYVAHGTQLQLSLRGASEDVLSDTSFVQPLISGKWIYSFDNATRLIARGAAGTTTVGDFEKLPTSLRFFSGGDKTVRGYTYNAVGPRLEGNVVGGKKLIESSLEYQVPVSEKWSVALFTDIGDAFDDKPDYKRGVGLGFHWRSPIGPVRLDFGHALDRPPGKQVRFHLTIGSDL